MKLRSLLTNLGLDEVVTYSFISADSLLNLNYQLSNHLQIENPLSSQQDYLRSSILPSHLQAAKNNFHHKPAAGIFELARVYSKHRNIEERWQLAISVWGDQSLMRLKGCLDQLLSYYKLQPDFVSDPETNFIAGRHLKIKTKSNSVGQIGQIKPAILAKFGVEVEFSYFEIEIEKIINQSAESNIRVLPSLPYQLVRRDLTIEIDNALSWQAISSTLQKVVTNVEFVDEFINQDLKNQQRKRVTMRLEFDLGSKPTLKQIEQSMTKCQNLLKEVFAGYKIKVL